MHVPNNETMKYVKQKLTELNKETDKFAVTVGNSNIPLSVIDTPKQKTREEEFSNIISQQN